MNDNEFKTYQCEVEAFSDVWLFMTHTPGTVHGYELKGDASVVGNLTLLFHSLLSLEEIKAILKDVMDGHVMERTVKEWNGENDLGQFKYQEIKNILIARAKICVERGFNHFVHEIQRPLDYQRVIRDIGKDTNGYITISSFLKPTKNTNTTEIVFRIITK